jgi:hypothetical protein
MIRPRRALLPELAISAALALACGGTDGTEDEGSSGADSTTGPACQDDDECEDGACHPQDHVCVADSCDPETEEIGPQPRDQIGDPCCTDKPGCTGYDRMGAPINPLYVGETLACVGEQWVADPGYCEGACDEDTVLIGCVWDSAQGDFVRPNCVCQQQ